MKILSIIKIVMSKELEKLGFKYQKENDAWLFIRNNNGNVEGIRIEKSNWEKNSIRFRFFNSGGQISSFRLTGERGESWYYYENESDLRNILIEILEITNKYALKWWNENQPIDSYPNELRTMLNHKEDFQKIIKDFQLSSTDPQMLVNVEELLRKHPKKDVVIAMTYFLGNIFIENLGGEWSYNEKKIPYIKHIGGFDFLNREMYDPIKNFLDSPFSESLLSYYKSFEETVSNLKQG